MIYILGLLKNQYDNERYIPQKYFALIIPAHNEEKVIENTIKSLKALNYPKNLYDIFVIADNCSDQTVPIAQKQGITVFERFNSTHNGKGYALAYIFNKIVTMNKKYDAIAVFDADNIISHDFLIHMNNELCSGNKVIQGQIESKNPFDSWITSSYSIFYWTISLLYQYPKSKLGLSCNLLGTGFVVDFKTLKDIGWGISSLSEDLEFTIKLILSNNKVKWSKKAVIYDEKPLTLIQSFHQRKRWMEGHNDIAHRYVPKLFMKAMKNMDLSALDLALYSMHPLRVLSIIAVFVLAWLQTMFPNGNVFKTHIVYLFSTPYVWYAILLAFLFCPAFLVIIAQKFNRRVLKGYLTYPIFHLTYAIIYIFALFNRNNKEWVHTKHYRDISINQIERHP